MDAGAAAGDGVAAGFRSVEPPPPQAPRASGKRTRAALRRVEWVTRTSRPGRLAGRGRAHSRLDAVGCGRAGYADFCCFNTSRISVSSATSGGVAAAGANRAASRLNGCTIRK